MSGPIGQVRSRFYARRPRRHLPIAARTALSVGSPLHLETQVLEIDVSTSVTGNGRTPIPAITALAAGETGRSKGRNRASVRPYCEKVREGGRIVSQAAVVPVGRARQR
jgi:hypothetical protein